MRAIRETPISMTGGPASGELILYRIADGRTAIRLRAVAGTVWLTQAEIAVLFDNTPQNVTQHLRHIYDDRELDEAATCKDLLQVQQEGGRSVQRSVKACAVPMRCERVGILHGGQFSRNP